MAQEVIVIIDPPGIPVCRKASQGEEKAILDRIEYIRELKLWIDKTVWKGLTDKKYDYDAKYGYGLGVSVCTDFVAFNPCNDVFAPHGCRIYRGNLLYTKAKRP